MKFNDITYKLSIIVLIVYALYSFGTSGIIGLLLTGAFTLIATSLVGTIEYVAIAVIAVGLLYSQLVKMYISSGNQSVAVKEGFNNNDNPLSVVKRLSAIKSKHSKGPVGILAVEGFQDVKHQNPDEDEEGESAISTPASKVRDNEVKVAKKVVESLVGKRSSKSPSSDDDNDNDDNDENGTDDDPVTNMVKTMEKFSPGSDSGGNTAGLFKLGELPSESGSGPIVDTGSTLLKAMSALKPTQISAMTTDTKKLIETQKGLMSMLQGMRPVLEDGRQLLDTFSNIFGGGNGGSGKK